MKDNIEILANIFNNIEQKISKKSFCTGIQALDECMDLPSMGGLGVILGKTKTGKTDFILDIIYSMSIIQSKNVVFFSGGLPATLVIRKLLARRLSCSTDDLRNGKIPLKLLDEIEKIVKKDPAPSLVIFDQQDFSTTLIMNLLESVTHKPDIIFFDNVWLCDTIAYDTVTKLKFFAEFHDCPILTVLQYPLIPQDVIDSANIVMYMQEKGAELSVIKNDYGPEVTIPIQRSIFNTK